MACRIQTGGPSTYRLAGPLSTASALSPEEQTRAEVLFDAFCSANSLKNITSVFQKLCECLKLRPNDYRTFYTRLKERMGFSWKWKSLQSKLDKRFSQKEYNQGNCCSHTKVLIVGAGPCGLRAAIEAALLGAKVVVLEKRDRFSRNNVLHLWPFVISDLRSLGAKKFYPKFCGGSVDHISIRILQCILLKVTLLLGVEVQYGVSFLHVVEPPEDQSKEKIGWRAAVHPADHHVASYEFDVLIGADGRRNTLQGFQRKVFRGMLAIAITSNFINRNTPQEQNVPELSGVARIYNQQFFKDLHDTTGIDLENIVYYRDETHYFVMTAKKASLLNKGVLINDYTEAERLLDRSNIDREALAHYAKEAAQFSTNNRLPNLEFAINQHGEPDTHVFDFTNMYAAENASRIVERKGHRLLVCLVGDSLVEPFWPLGTGCAHGFLGVLDASWMIRQWALGYQTPLQLLTEREAIYRPLTSISPEHLHKNYLNYSIDPLSRYLHVDMTRTSVRFVRHLLDTDAPENVDKSELVPMRKTHPTGFTPKRVRRESISQDSLLEWCRLNLEPHGVHLDSLRDFWRNYRPLCALIHHFRPELIDYKDLDSSNGENNWLLALKVAEEQLGIALGFSPVNSVRVKENLSADVIVPVIAQLYELFRREVPGEFVPQLSMDSPSFDALLTGSKRRSTSGSDKASRLTPSSPSHMSKRTMTVKENGKDPSKRRKGYHRESLHGIQKRRESLEPIQINMGEKIKFLEAAFNPERVEKTPQRTDSQRRANPLVPGTLQQMEAKLKDGTTMQSEFDYKLKRLDSKLHDGTAGLVGGVTKAKADEYSSGLRETPQKSRANSRGEQEAVNVVPVWTPEQAIRSDQTCYFCQKRVYPAERKSAENLFFHRMCFKCHHCNKILQINGDYTFDRYDPSGGKFYCLNHFKNRKHDYSQLPSPAKESPPKPFDRSPEVLVDDLDGFTFARFPSRSSSPHQPPPVSPRHPNDDSDEDEYVDAPVLDEEQVTLHNFGDAIRTSLGADDVLRADDEDTSEDEAWVSIDKVADDVEDWKRKYNEKRNTPTTSNESGSTSGDSGGPGRSTRLDKSDRQQSVPSVTIRNSYEDSTSPGSTSDQECDSEVRAVTSPSSASPSSDRPNGPRAVKPSVITVSSGPVEVKVERLTDQHHRLTVLSSHTQTEGSPTGGTTFYTPPTSVLLDHRPKSREIKWDSKLVETAKRLRGLRMSSESDNVDLKAAKAPEER
ncbi:hypothetical protein RvY_01088 [Ramazzottius varieornatus]|uniref:F-actin monooxygenase n=1 Tax=Ramazzottius varieornatus TaxID=947166 RepID=A0A1D1UF18_RAMVA|nr:hypothetical protein RvY_01088 [Ramazzottius varieornatus]